MAWSLATSYRARIGGIVYRNVADPIVVGGRPALTLWRSDDTGDLAISLELREQNRRHIASVAHNRIDLHASSDFLIISGLERSALVEIRNGRVWCDIRVVRNNADYELDVSCILFSESGYPLFLHPDRSKFGKANDNRPPNISRLTLSTDQGSQGGAIAIGSGAIYLLELAIENFRTGVMITPPQTHAPD